MDTRLEMRFSLAVIISFFMHAVIAFCFILPRIQAAWDDIALLKKVFGDSALQRDVIVNINEDGRRVVTSETLLSERDASARGFITPRTGNRWLNNSLDFRMLKGEKGAGKGGAAVAVRAGRDRVIMVDESEVVMVIEHKAASSSSSGASGLFDDVRIPDKNDVTRENAIFYSNDGRFSFNTVKFKDFKYFKDMKDKIASNWFPPLMANAVIQGYNPLTGNYTPGSTRIMAIPSQEVKMVFVLNREGEVIRVEILDSLGHKELNRSCVDAIRLSKNFGPVPKDLLHGGVLVIPFIFGYYVY